MKILFYIHAIACGGAERVMANVSSQFAQDGYDVVLVTTIISKDDYPVDKNVRRIQLAADNKNKGNVITKNIRYIGMLSRIIKEENPDVAISFMGEPNFRLLMAGGNVKKIISIRNDPRREYGGWRGRLTKNLFGRAAGIICQTDDAKAWLPERLQSRCEVIMNQVAPAFFNTPRQSEDYYMANGRLDVQKNYPLLINAFHDFLQVHPTAKLRIYGRGPLMDSLSNMVEKNGDSANITFEGWTNDVPNALSHAKAFILSSNFEGMPNGLIEALAMGLPCISTDCPCGGPKMVINNGENGILVPVDDCKALADALCRIEEDAEFRKSIGVEAKNKAKDFSADVVYARWKAFVEKVVR